MKNDLDKNEDLFDVASQFFLFLFLVGSYITQGLLLRQNIYQHFI